MLFVQRVRFFIQLFLILFFQTYALDAIKPQANLSLWPIALDNPGQNQNQQDPYNFSTPQNSGFSPLSTGQDWYQQYRKLVLYNTVPVMLQGKIINITQEDIALINRICADNPHKPFDELRVHLAQNSAFNAAQNFFQGDNLLHAFALDIFINPEHFKSLSSAAYRCKKLQDSAQQAMQNRHAREKSQLELAHKTQFKAAKKISKKEENKVAARHKKEWDDLKDRQKKEKKYPLGRKQKSQKNVIEAQFQNITEQQTTTPAAQTAKITEQELQKVQNRTTKIIEQSHTSDDCEFQNIMQQRSQALQKSMNNSAVTIEQIKINPQTTGFLQAQGIDAAQFQHIEGLPIQHQLTYELVNTLDAVADYALHHHEIYQNNLTNYCTYLASLSQQSNTQGFLNQAVQGINCCHGIQHYLEGMVAGIGQQYQKFQTALHYFQPILQEYALSVEQHALQGIVMIQGLEALATVGLIAAPTATAAGAAMMLGTAAYVMAPVCAQAMIDATSFGGACIMGNWDKVAQDLDSFSNFISLPETIGRMAELAVCAAIPTPNLSFVMDQIVSLRPVITSVQQACGQTSSKLYLMTKNQAQQVYRQSVELLQSPEFINFNMSFKNILGCNFFKLLEQEQCDLIPAFATGIENNAFSSGQQAAVTQLFNQSEGLIVGNIVKSITHYTVSNTLLESNYAFLQTNIGDKIVRAITKPYEETMLSGIAKQYEKLITNQAPKNVIDTFCKCHEKSLVPDNMTQNFLLLHEQFKDKYPGLPEFSTENPYLTMQMRHIFYPSLQPKLDKNYQVIENLFLMVFIMMNMVF